VVKEKIKENYMGTIPIRLLNFLDEKSFRRLGHSIIPQSFGNFFYTFANGSICIRFIQDRSVQNIEIASSIDDKPIDDEDWTDIGLIKSFLLKEENWKIGQGMSVDEKIDFLICYFDSIAEIFSSKNYTATALELSALSRKRNKQLFGW
jgi:hypothetical protein